MNIYITKSFKNYKKVRVYWICNNNLPTNLDYIVVGCINNDENINKNFNKSLKWIMNNLEATLIISCPDLQDIENTDKLTHYLPIPFLKELENKVNNKDKSINLNNIYFDMEKMQILTLIHSKLIINKLLLVNQKLILLLIY